ncbi:MAG: molybdopterin molybdotransferase MoeA [Porticoccaceae bacterium]|nr:molybdopterin molybdotransferase MoeA [Porticoccaceae bacterium]
MLSVSDALNIMSKSVKILASTETYSLKTSLGKVLAEDIFASLDIPATDNSAVDGYALCYREAKKNKFELPLSQRIVAGQKPNTLTPDTAARIFTGGVLPKGADTVALQEHCYEHAGMISLDKKVIRGKNIRQKGQDIGCGEKILSKGLLLRPQDLGLLASLGIDTVKTYKPLTIGFFTTGDELLQPGDKFKEGKIYDSNKVLLGNLISHLGMISVDLGVAPDNLNKTINLIKNVPDTVDIIISAGGVSVGDCDYVKAAIDYLGEINFWRVSIKPGKPFLFGHAMNRPFMGLPGNTASVFVTFLILVMPFLFWSQGYHSFFHQTFKATSLFSREAGNRQIFHRAKVSKDGVQLHKNQSSGVLSSASWGNVLAIQHPHTTINEGDLVDVIPFNSLTLGAI